MQFQTSHIPADINTYEKLAAWANTVLWQALYALEYNERPASVVTGDSGIQAVVERNGPDLAFDKTHRLIYRTSFALEPDHDSPGYTQVYQAVKELTTAPANIDMIAS